MGRLDAIGMMALVLMRQWGLARPCWQFRFSRSKTMMGRCVYPRPSGGQPGYIELSRYYVLGKNDDESVRDTILHEIAHALAGPHTGHGQLWKEMCLMVGARPVRCSEADMPSGPWRATCPNCKKVYSYHRRPRCLDTGNFYYCGMPKCGRIVGVLEFKYVKGS